MNTSIDIAARELLSTLSVPNGSVTTYVDRKATVPTIRLVVTKKYKYLLSPAPTRFNGHPVALEVRESAEASSVAYN